MLIKTTFPRYVVARVVAILLIVCIVPLLWHLMMRLTWQVNCVIAVVSCLLFAYVFERQEEH